MKILIYTTLLILGLATFTDARQYAQVKSSIVINIFNWDETRNPAIAGHNFVDITAMPTKPNIGDSYDGSTFTPSTPAAVTHVRKITIWEFWKRFTQAERQALTNSTNALVKTVAQDIKMMGDTINLDDIELVADFDALVTAAIISAQRKVDILK